MFIHTVVAFAQWLPASSHHKPASVPRAEFFLQGKTAFRADGEGAAGRRGWHRQLGCVENFKTRSLNRVNINLKKEKTSKRRSGTHLCAFHNATNGDKSTLATSMYREQRAQRQGKRAPVNCSNIQETTKKRGVKSERSHRGAVHTDRTHGD